MVHEILLNLTRDDLFESRGHREPAATKRRQETHRCSRPWDIWQRPHDFMAGWGLAADRMTQARER